MGKSSLSCLVAITVSFSVYGSCVACSEDSNDNLEGILGRNINLTCITTLRCNSIGWDRPTITEVLSLPGEPVQACYSKSYLPISGISFDNDGLYRCFCYVSPGSNGYEICQVHLKTICQATVILNGRRNVFNSSTSRTHYVTVTVGTSIKIKCPEGGRSQSNCRNVHRKESDEFTYKFKVLPKHKSCHIECRLGSEDGTSCSVHFTLNVAVLETSTKHSITSTRTSTISYLTTRHTEKNNAVPHKSGSFPVMLLTGISIVVFVGILSIICFFIYISRSKSTFRPKKTQNPGNESPDTNISIDPTYAIVNESTSVCLKDHDDSERGIPCTDDAYAEINRTMKEESSNQKVKAVKTETSITKDYYSVVNTSNIKLESTDGGNKKDSALYTEVNKEAEQVGEKVGTSSPESSDCNPNVPDVQSFDVLQQPENSEYDDVGHGVVSTSPALYAVVDN